LSLVLGFFFSRLFRCSRLAMAMIPHSAAMTMGMDTFCNTASMVLKRLRLRPQT
jgi:hypothetical protein